MANKPYVDKTIIDGVTYDIRAANGTPVISGYGGNDLSEEFENAAELHAAIAAGDFSKIRVGDFWPITLSGSYKNFAKYTVPAGTTYYTEASLTNNSGTTEAAMAGYYQSATAVKITISGTDYFVSINDCSLGYTETLNNAVMKMEVAAINPYIQHGDTALTAQHVLFCSRDCLPPTLAMRAANSVWHDTAAVNPWLGSALYATLNDEDDGIIKLVEATDLGQYLFKGPRSKGMRALLPTMASGAAAPTSWAWNNRGKLFLPTEREVFGAPVWQQASYEAGNLYNQWPIFAGSARHIMKGAGNGGGRCDWWLETATTAASFAHVDSAGGANDSYAAATYIRAPLCFLAT